MELWLQCWNCGHETPQERKHYDTFYRVQEIFSKESDGPVRNQYYAPLVSSHAFYKCKKCGAPNYYVHEYWPTEKESDTATQEALDFRNSIKEDGKWAEDKLYRIYHFPTFHQNSIPSWTKGLSEDLMRLFWETYAAQQNGLTTLCAMGIRSVIDVFAVAKVGDIGGFAKKLDRLKQDGYISDIQYSTLSIVSEAGNAAAHRGYCPTTSQTNACLEVLEAIFFFEIKNKELVNLRDSIPGRKK